MVAGDSRGRAPAERPTLLPPARRKRGVDVHRLRFRAELAPRRDRPPGPPSAGGGPLRRAPRRHVSTEGDTRHPLIEGRGSWLTARMRTSVSSVPATPV